MAMVRLQKELISTLTQNKQYFENGCMSIPTCVLENPKNEKSIVPVNALNASQSESNITETEEHNVLDLLPQDMIPQIKSIADVMFASSYDEEFCHAFIQFGRGAFAVYLSLTDVNVEELSIKDFPKIEWECLNTRIKNWCNAIKILIASNLVSAKHLFDQILGEYGLISSTCLFEACKESVTCLLNLGHDVAGGPHGPEHLFHLLDMYEVLVALIHVDALFPQDTGSLIRFEFYKLLARLADAAKIILKELGTQISSHASRRSPFANGGIDPLSKYVMNYIVFLAEEYSGTLNSLLEEKDSKNFNRDLERSISNPMAARLQSWTSILESNLDKMSNLYRSSCLKHLFMTNNIHYMVQKITNSGIRGYFGDEWINKHVGKFQFHALSYQRHTWSPLLPLLCYDNRTIKKATLKARYRKFMLAFENVYKSQTGWCVPNLQLRQDLRILAEVTVVLAYRNFAHWTNSAVGEKLVKLTVNDFENCIQDLLEGSSKSLNHSRRRLIWKF